MNCPWHPDELPKATNDTALMREQLDIFGYCIIDNALSPTVTDTIRNRLVEQAEIEREIHSHKNPANIDPVNQWVGMLLNKGQIFLELLRHTQCAGLLEHMLGEDFLFSCVDAQIQHPGSKDMPLHTDQWWMPEPIMATDIRHRPGEYFRGRDGSVDASISRTSIGNIAEANIMWMITDFEEANGATRLVPGSHLSGRQPDPQIPHPIATVAATGAAGTAFAFDGRLWHGGAANHTATARYGVTTAGCGPQFRQIENYSRGMRPEVFEKCEINILRRLGFTSWSGYGHTGNPEESISRCGQMADGPLFRKSK